MNVEQLSSLLFCGNKLKYHLLTHAEGRDKVKVLLKETKQLLKDHEEVLLKIASDYDVKIKKNANGTVDYNWQHLLETEEGKIKAAEFKEEYDKTNATDDYEITSERNFLTKEALIVALDKTDVNFAEDEILDEYFLKVE